MRNPIPIGSRGSKLALAQTNQVIDLLIKFAGGGVRFEVVPIRTKGDQLHDFGNSAVEGKSLYTEEIEKALVEIKVDVAVHSMKDLTTDIRPGLIIAAVPERANPFDVLISKDKKKFQELRAGARIGTSSPRRQAQLLAARGDLRIVEMHGNVDTRLHKLGAGDYDAIVVAAAGLIRLGLEKHVTEFLSTEVMLPAVGQGALAVQCREDDDEVKKLLAQIDHDGTRRAVEAERAFARRLGANCRTPIAAHARIQTGKLAIDGMVATLNGRTLIRCGIVSDTPDAGRVGEELAELIIAKGAADILEAA